MGRKIPDNRAKLANRSFITLFVVLIISAYLFLSGVASYAASKPEPLQLQCTVNISNYNGIDHASVSKDIVLSQLKHKTGGAVLVSQTDDYEFWAMTHGQQTINNVTFFNNFQIAIKDKKSNLFMHALSDTSNLPDVMPVKARLSLVKYIEGSFIEDGELLYECVVK